jgi:hypothetical protein
VPLTLGNHVDHQLTRRAAEQCFPAALRVYYEDYPYAGRHSAEQFIAAQAGSWHSNVIRITKNGAAARIRAIKCYESQLSTFFRDESDLEHQLMTFINATGGERVWKQLQD